MVVIVRAVGFFFANCVLASRGGDLGVNESGSSLSSGPIREGFTGIPTPVYRQKGRAQHFEGLLDY